MRSWILIGLWVLAILFPLAWLGTLDPASKNFIDWLLAPEWLHVVMHVIIYAGLILLILMKQRRDGKTISFAALVAIILVVGVFQELFQYLTDDYQVSLMRTLRGSAFDLMVDLAGGMLGLGIYFKILDRPPEPLPQPMERDHGED